MEALQNTRTNLFDSFNREFYTLEKALSEELARHAAVNARRNHIDGVPSVPSEAYESLREKYNSLTKQYSNLQAAHSKTVDKWRAAKAHIKTWETYHERCKARELAKATKEHGAEAERGHDSDTLAVGARPGSNEGPEHNRQLLKAPLPTASNMLMPASTPRAASQRPGRTDPPDSCKNTAISTHMVEDPDKVTQDDVDSIEHREYPKALSPQGLEREGRRHGAEELPMPKRGSIVQDTSDQILWPNASGYSSDKPVVVSERTVKKRKRPSNVRSPRVARDDDVQQIGSVAKPIHVKSEDNSSSPAPGRRGDLVMQDSLDLDDVGARLITPRKRRRLQELLRLSQSNLSTVSAGVRAGQAALAIQPLEVSTERNLAMSPNGATKPGEREKQERTRLFQDISKPPTIRAGAGLFVNLEEQSNADFDNPPLETKDSGWEASPSLQRSKQPLHKPIANILHLRRTEIPNDPAQVISFAAPNTPGNANDHGRPKSQFLKPDAQPVRASRTPPNATIFGTPPFDQLAAVKAEGVKVLQPTNPNAQIQPRTSELRSSSKGQKQRARRDNIADRMPLVTEDGENFSEKNVCRGAKSVAHGLKETGKSSGQHDQEKVDFHVHRRLASLLDEPSPEKALLAPTSPSHKATKAKSKSPQRPSAHSPTGNDRGHILTKLLAAANTPTRRPSPTEQARKSDDPRRSCRKSAEHKAPPDASQQPPPTPADDPPPIDPDDEPFRARPLHRLGPDHFRINPHNNQGLDYAFTEVVRNHDQRRCLPGCTRPSCCGSAFRKLVKIGGLPTPRTSGLWSSSPPEDKDHDTQEQADTRLLKEYMGKQYDRRWLGMSEADRKEALLKAKTWAFADQHGRHRQAFERRATPPGFWRTDMPSTQEVERDREEARGLERRRVEEMYREAMREGGRWRFRDE